MSFTPGVHFLRVDEPSTDDIIHQIRIFERANEIDTQRFLELFLAGKYDGIQVAYEWAGLALALARRKGTPFVDPEPDLSGYALG